MNSGRGTIAGGLKGSHLGGVVAETLMNEDTRGMVDEKCTMR